MTDPQHTNELLGGLSPEQFMRRYWQKRPLMVRKAIPSFAPPVGRTGLFELASREDVESRMIERRDMHWRLRRGPLARRALPKLAVPGWTLLVQGVDLHDDRVHALMQRFRFVPDARLDDVMISFATDGGGVGPHFDSYDVFLLQAFGRRRWRIGRQKNLSLVDDLPLKILANFEPEEEFVLEPCDMLYLPPRWAHDGVAEGECITYSIGFRQPTMGELARELLQRLSDDALSELPERAYTDPDQPATATPGAIPPAMQAFARHSLGRALQRDSLLDICLGEWLTEPKPQVWFNALEAGDAQGAVALDRRSRMLYDLTHVYLNGDAFRASGRDARLMRKLADQRRLDADDVARLSSGAAELLHQWMKAGWLHAN